MKRTGPVRFTQSTLTVYDLEEWNPFDEYIEDDFVGDTLDLQEISEIGRCSRTILEEYGLGDIPFDDGRVEGEEVGDDRIDLSSNPLKLSTGLAVQEIVMGYVTSWEDTNLSTRVSNFCEVTSWVPVYPEQSFHACRKIGDFENLGFTDVPPLRIILDVMKGDRSHSSTAVGKAAMLGSRSRTPRSEFSKDFHLSSYLQDGHLRTSRSSDPKYLPQVMGGSGVRPLFANDLNLYLYVLAYKGGKYQRIYGSATRELRQSLDSLEKGERVIMPILCRRLRDRQEYLHATYDAKIFIPTEGYKKSFAGTLPEPLLRSSGGANLFASFENRLQRTRHVITRSDAEREWENSLRIRDRLLARYTTTQEALLRQAYDKQAARREFGGALNANTAFTNLLERKGSLQDVIQLTNENFHVVNCGTTGFTKWDAQWLFAGGKSEHFSIDDLTTSEDLFLRTEVSEEESMRVGSLLLRPIVGKAQQLVRTRAQVGMYQIGTGMYEWASDLSQRLTRLRDQRGHALSPEDALTEYEVSPEWVNDDSLLIARCLRDTGGRSMRSTPVILVSADKRLGHQMAETCNVTVYRVGPASYIMLALALGRDPMSEIDPFIISSYINGLSDAPAECIYTDTGSVAAFLSKISHHDDEFVYIKRITSESFPEQSAQKRSYTYDLVKLDIRAQLKVCKHTPVLAPKRFRGGGTPQGESSSRRSRLTIRSLSHKSWREGI